MKQVAPRDLRTRYLESLLAFRQGDAAKAKEPILEVLKVAPEHLPSRLLAGAIELQLGQIGTAEDHLRRVVAAAPRASLPRLLLATAYLRQGQLGRAEDAIEPALKQEPNNPRVLQMAGEVALAKGDLARASKYYERATAVDKDNARLRTRLAQARFASGDVGQGFKELESASASDPAQYQADVALILAHASRREYDKALAAAATLEKKQPDNPLTHDLKGRVYLLKGDRNAARASFEKSLALSFDYLPALRNLAAMDIADKQPDAARKRFDAVLAKAPGNEGALLGLAEVLAATRASAKEVAGALERAVAANPNSVNARLTLDRLSRPHEGSERRTCRGAGRANRASKRDSDPRRARRLAARRGRGQPGDRDLQFTRHGAAELARPAPAPRACASGGEGLRRCGRVAAPGDGAAPRPDGVAGGHRRSPARRRQSRRGPQGGPVVAGGATEGGRGVRARGRAARPPEEVRRGGKRLRRGAQASGYRADRDPAARAAAGRGQDGRRGEARFELAARSSEGAVGAPLPRRRGSAEEGLPCGVQGVPRRPRDQTRTTCSRSTTSPGRSAR